MKLRLTILAVITAVVLAIGISTTVNNDVIWTDANFKDSFNNLNLAEYDKQHKNTHILDQIGLDKEDLVKRLQEDKRLKLASTYNDPDTAKHAIITVLTNNSEKIVSWLNHPGSPEKKSFSTKFEKPIGTGVKRSNPEKIIKLKKAVVVLVKLKSNNFSILTSYPE